MQPSSPLTLAGRTAVVTGGSRNLGLGSRTELVIGSPGSAESAAKSLASAGGAALGIQCDVADAASVDAALARAAQHFGGIDIVVNSAGILDLAKVHEMTVEHWDRVLAINLRGTFLVIQKALPYLEKSRAPRVINLSSNSGRMGGFENGMAYSASKGGVIALTYGLARQLAARKITVNCIAPGTIESDMSRARDAAAMSRLLGRFPLGRLGTADEVAAAACYFASEEAGFTTGAVLDVNGGLFMG